MLFAPLAELLLQDRDGRVVGALLDLEPHLFEVRLPRLQVGDELGDLVSHALVFRGLGFLSEPRERKHGAEGEGQ